MRANSSALAHPADRDAALGHAVEELLVGLAGRRLRSCGGAPIDRFRSGPTSIALTSTPCGAFSLESALVSASPAARLTLVGVESAPGALAPMLSTLTMRPHLRSRMPGSAARHRRIAAKQL